MAQVIWCCFEAPHVWELVALVAHFSDWSLLVPPPACPSCHTISDSIYFWHSYMSLCVHVKPYLGAAVAFESVCHFDFHPLWHHAATLVTNVPPMVLHSRCCAVSWQTHLPAEYTMHKMQQSHPIQYDNNCSPMGQPFQLLSDKVRPK